MKLIESDLMHFGQAKDHPDMVKQHVLSTVTSRHVVWLHIWRGGHIGIIQSSREVGMTDTIRKQCSK